MKIVITGTHLSPALAVARLLKKKKHTVLFLGRKYAFEEDSTESPEYTTFTSLGFPFKHIVSGRLQRIWTAYTFPSLLKIPRGFLQALWFLLHFNPTIILSFGGYVSFPVVISGSLLRIPIVIHEQTQGAGLANRIGALFAKKVLISWGSSRKFFPNGKTLLTGNPIREEVWSSKLSTLPSALSTQNLPIIYITGGGLGSHAINRIVEGSIKKLLESFVVIHQTGDAKKYKDFERLMKLRSSLPATRKERYFLTKYVGLNDIGWVLRRAHVVVGRAGANTISELLALSKPSLLIPLPFSGSSEQIANAKLLKAIGLSEILPQAMLTTASFYNTIKEMTENIERYRKNRKVLMYKDAAVRIVEVLLDEAKEGKRGEKSFQ